MAQFFLGLVYSKGEDIKRDIKQAIHYYKEASSLNSEYAKNNLAIIYKNGIDTNVNLGYAIELLKEAIRLGDSTSMYNLSHIYFYEKGFEDKTEEILDLLIKSSYKFPQSKKFMSIVLINKCKNNKLTLETVRKEIEKHENDENKIKQLANDIYFYIKNNYLETKFVYEYVYQKLKSIDYMYDYKLCTLPTYRAIITEKEEVISGQNINKYFYEGFGMLKPPS